MERLNKETLSFSAKVITKAFAALGLMVFLTACPGGGGGGNGGVVVGPNGGCGSCGINSPITLTTFQAELRDYSGYTKIALRNIQLIGQSTNVMPNATGNLYANYQGPIAMQGVLEVLQTSRDPQNMNCVVPAGTYQLNSTVTGQMVMNPMYAASIVMPSLITNTGGIELSIEAPADSYGMGLYEHGTRLYAKVSVIRVNGHQCSPQFYNVFN